MVVIDYERVPLMFQLSWAISVMLSHMLTQSKSP